MRIHDGFLSVLMATILILSIFPCSNARTHFHRPKSTHKHNGRQTSQSPLPSPPAEPPTFSGSGEPCVFNVRDYGAVGDGDSDDTQAFRDAWKEACSQENSVLLVPSDGVFTITSTIFSGPCQPGFILQVDGVLMPPDGPYCWPKSDSRRQWLVFYRVDGMTLQGGGTIEGNGEKWWNLPCKPHRGPNGTTLPGPCDSPAMIRFFMSSNLTVRDIRIENSPQFHVKFDGCNGVHIEGLSISSPALSPNRCEEPPDTLCMQRQRALHQHYHVGSGAASLRRGARRRPLLLECLWRAGNTYNPAHLLPCAMDEL